MPAPHTEVTVDVIPPCDFDNAHGPAHADFKTNLGPWANGCLPCFKRYGGALGLGKGQKYVERKDAA